ncbi:MULTISPECIES: glycosyltransferase family 2 protein [Vibrio]|uniref:Glycosyl transferase family 2 n=4 Tax=Vibrio TaxID=662 RepID=A0A2N7NM69_9VIBR|nr:MULTISPECIES: glycosyltransferase family 2 protein [Vibrio]EAQ53116.1 glycosyl transferase, group 2 family protein [Vibrio sp. MED222]PMP16962.1 glycosyl transferase family 2 [Vibrio tasmaniensis]TKG28683.1 glycosyltransferase family 2 protein [Vibrio tasmaniensis]TKG39505.1 glycosyltransferase family 2 protein [Vibrio tasmaniensis]TKG43387.1 glycosyltransferase family 2 protein [Vibrio tasmaniensis]
MNKLRLIIPSYNEGVNINKCAEKLLVIYENLIDRAVIDISSDILFVDDGSKDDTWSRIEALAENNDKIKGIKLSINKGHQVALKSGLDCSVDKCDFSISLDADLQQDPSVIEDFILDFKNGNDVVYGVRKDRNTDGLLKKTLAKCFYRLAKKLGIDLVPGHADYRGLSNKALDILSSHDGKNPFLRGIIPTLGLRSSIVEFDVYDREHGESKYTFEKMMNLALSGIISFSIVPLRLFAALGGLIVLTCILMSLYILSMSIIFGGTVPGWASITLPIYFLGGIQLIGLSVIGEYIGRVFIEVNKAPTYIIDRVTENNNRI